MATVIGIMGESGSGKTTSMRNLDPKKTYYIDADKKGLSWRGWKKQYSPEAKNYFRSDDQTAILKLLKAINDNTKAPIENIVIDTMNGIMIGDEMRRFREKGYDKWADLAIAVYEIIDYALQMREGLYIIMLFHTQTIRDDNGNTFTSIKTNGQKLNKIGLETKLPIVLQTKCLDGKYVFETQANNSTAKSPMEMLPLTMENDIAEVIKLSREYENG